MSLAISDRVRKQIAREKATNNMLARNRKQRGDPEGSKPNYDKIARVRQELIDRKNGGGKKTAPAKQSAGTGGPRRQSNSTSKSKAKPEDKPEKKSGASRSTANKVSAKSGASRSVKNKTKPSPPSGPPRRSVRLKNRNAKMEKARKKVTAGVHSNFDEYGRWIGPRKPSNLSVKSRKARR